MEKSILDNEQFDFSAFINEYQSFTRVTAQYPVDMAVAYTRLGFLGELGEIANKYKKVIRGDYKLEDIKDDLSKECGDLIWYFVRYLDELDYRASWGFKQVGFDRVNYSVLNTIEALIDEIASTFNRVPLVDNHYLLQNIGILLNLLCLKLDTTIVDVLTQNRRKLQDRLERNVIKGSGDNR